MKILAIGDVVGNAGVYALENHLRTIKREFRADFTVVNAENAAGTGLLPAQADALWDAGADVLTLGNHVWGKRQIVPYLEENRYLLRPHNLAPQSPGEGYGIYEVCGYRVLLVNLIGRCEMQFGPDNPFLAIDRLLKQEEGRYDLCLCEIHAGATSEKQAMGFYLDGRCAAVWGTHTHVQTADARINPQGTGYITDLGMTGPYWSVLGVEAEQSIAMFRGDLTERFRTAEGECVISGCVFAIDTGTGKCTGAEAFQRRIPEGG